MKYYMLLGQPISEVDVDESETDSAYITVEGDGEQLFLISTSLIGETAEEAFKEFSSAKNNGLNGRAVTDSYFNLQMVETVKLNHLLPIETNINVSAWS
jgi:hypothetical protein